MPKAALLQTSFAAGELSPRLGSRIDIDRYTQGVETLQNAIVLPQGGALRRSGTKYIAATKTSSKASRLVAFEFSTTTAYVLEFGDLYIRVFKDGAPVYSSGTTPVEIVTTYAESEIWNLRFCQSLDTLYIVHPSHRPATLTRTSDTVWTLADITFSGGPVRTYNTTEIGLEPSAVSGSITLYTANVIGNGTFTGNINGWTDSSPTAPPAGAIQYNSNAMRVVGAAGHEGVGTAAFIVVPSTTYQFKITYTLTSGPGGIIAYISRSSDYTSAADRILTQDEFASGTYTYTFTTGASDTMLYLHLWTDHNYFTVDNITIRPSYFTAAMAGTIFKLNQNSYTETISNSFTAAAQTGTAQTLRAGEFILDIAFGAGAVGTVDLQVSYNVGTSYETVASYSVPTRVRIVDAITDVKYRLYSSAWTSGTIATQQIQAVTLGSGVVLASTYVDAYTMTGTVQDTFVNTSGTIDWADGAWSAVRGYPSLVSFYENRLMFAANTEKPMTVWGSQTDDYTNFATTAANADNEAVEYSLLSRQMNAIVWMEPWESLRLGTAGGEWYMSGATDSEPLTPSSVRAREDGSFGSAARVTVKAAGNVLYVQRSGKAVMEMAYISTSDTQGYVSTDLTVLAEHLFRTYTITDMAFQKFPNSILWAVRSDGVLCGLSYQRGREIMAWHRHVTDGAFESVAVIHGTARDELWAIVKRTINGATVRYVECLQADFDGTDCEDAFFVDCGLSYDGYNTTTTKYLKVSGTSYADGATVTLTATGHTPFTNPGSIGKYYRLRSGADVVDVVVTAYTSTSAVTGTLSGTAGTALQNTNTSDWALMASTLSLAHLEGETVSVLADGGVHADCTVASGIITLDSPAAVIHGGLAYTTDIKTMRPEGGAADGTSQGRNKKIDRVIPRFYQTRGAKIGRDASHLDVIPFDDDGDDYSGIPLPVYSNDYPFDYDGDIEAAGQVLIRQDQPLPMCVLGLVIHLETFER